MACPNRTIDNYIVHLVKYVVSIRALSVSISLPRACALYSLSFAGMRVNPEPAQRGHLHNSYLVQRGPVWLLGPQWIVHYHKRFRICNKIINGRNGPEIEQIGFPGPW